MQLLAVRSLQRVWLSYTTVSNEMTTAELEVIRDIVNCFAHILSPDQYKVQRCGLFQLKQSEIALILR